MKEKTWQEIIKIEPQLKKLFEESCSIKDDGIKNIFCANKIWYENFKPKLEKLVGWDAVKQSLRNEDDYDIVYRKIYDVLPPCRNCSCS